MKVIAITKNKRVADELNLEFLKSEGPELRILETEVEVISLMNISPKEWGDKIVIMEVCENNEMNVVALMQVANKLRVPIFPFGADLDRRRCEWLINLGATSCFQSPLSIALMASHLKRFCSFEP